MDFSMALRVIKRGGKVWRTGSVYGRAKIMMFDGLVTSGGQLGRPVVGIEYELGIVEAWSPNSTDMLAENWAPCDEASAKILASIQELDREQAGGFFRARYDEAVKADTVISRVMVMTDKGIEFVDGESKIKEPVFTDGFVTMPGATFLDVEPSAESADGKADADDVAGEHHGRACTQHFTSAGLALLDRINKHEAETMRLVREVQAYTAKQRTDVHPMYVLRAIDNAEPERWAALARTDLQTGFMFLVRAVAQPVTP